MGKKHSPNLKIIAMTSMAVFSLAAVFVSTAAWFTVMRQVKTDGGGFLASKLAPVVTKVEIFEKATTSVQKDSEKNPYIYKSAPSLSYFYGSDQETIKGNTKTISIGTYSILEETKSLLFLFYLDTSKTEELKTSQLTVRTSTGDEDSLHALDSGVLKNPLNSDRNQNALSSIVSFSSFTDPSVISISKEDSTYVVDKTKIAKASQDKTFVDSSTYHYSSSIPLTDTDTDLSSVSQIGVIVEYSTNLIERLYSINLGNKVMNTLSDIEFNKIDFSFHI